MNIVFLTRLRQLNKRRCHLFFGHPKNFIKQKKLSIICLKDKTTQKNLSHDNIFHSVLGLMDISTTVYQSQLDLFKSCRA